MKRFESSAKPTSEREGDLRRRSEFQTVLLGVAGHDLHLPVQVIQSTDEWLSSILDTDAGKVRQQLGEPAVARLSEQLDRLAGALRLYENTTKMGPSPVPLRLFSTVRQKRLDQRIRPNLAVVIMSTAVLLNGILRNLVRNAIQICRRLFS
jgi:hypothetical protein